MSNENYQLWQTDPVNKYYYPKFDQDYDDLAELHWGFMAIRRDENLNPVEIVLGTDNGGFVFSPIGLFENQYTFQAPPDKHRNDEIDQSLSSKRSDFKNAARMMRELADEMSYTMSEWAVFARDFEKLIEEAEADEPRAERFQDVVLEMRERFERLQKYYKGS